MTDERRTDLSPEEKRIREAVRGLGEVRAEPAFRERLKRQFVTGEFAERPDREEEPAGRRRSWGWVLIPAVAAVLLILLLPPRPPAWTIHGVSGEGRVVVNGETLGADQLDRPGRRLGPAARVEVTEELVLDLKMSDGLLVELAEGTDVALPDASRHPSEQPLISEVFYGELRLKTGPGFAGRRLRIVTSESITDLVGTAVSVFKDKGLTCVCVLEGTAMIGEDEARMEEVPPGKRKIMFANGAPSLILGLEPNHEDGLSSFLERNKDVFHPAD